MVWSGMPAAAASCKTETVMFAALRAAAALGPYVGDGKCVSHRRLLPIYSTCTCQFPLARRGHFIYNLLPWTLFPRCLVAVFPRLAAPAFRISQPIHPSGTAVGGQRTLGTRTADTDSHLVTRIADLVGGGISTADSHGSCPCELGFFNQARTPPIIHQVDNHGGKRTRPDPICID